MLWQKSTTIPTHLSNLLHFLEVKWHSKPFIRIKLNFRKTNSMILFNESVMVIRENAIYSIFSIERERERTVVEVDGCKP
jgi:hypothetical protein